MTKLPIDQSPAGPALDASVARVLYGNDIVIDFNHGLIATSEKKLQESLTTGWIGCDNIMKGEEVVFCLHLPKWSTNIMTAWTLVELLHKQGNFFTLAYENDGCECYCSLNNAIGDNPSTIDFEVEADTFPLAIVRAYLKAHGITEIEMSID